MWAGRLVLQSQNDSHVACCGQLYLLPSLTVHVCECIYKMDMTQPYELEGWFRLVHWANGTIMDIRGLSLPGICIWVFWNLTLLHKDASAPPVIYHNIKPVLYYNLIHLPRPKLCLFSATSASLFFYPHQFVSINKVKKNTSDTSVEHIFCQHCFKMCNFHGVTRRVIKKIRTLFNNSILSSQFNLWDIDLVSEVAEGAIIQFQLLWC